MRRRKREEGEGSWEKLNCTYLISAGGYRPSHSVQLKIGIKFQQKWLEGVSRSAVQIWNTKEFGKWEKVMLGENVYFEWVMQYLHFDPGPHQEIHHISVIAHFCVPP